MKNNELLPVIGIHPVTALLKDHYDMVIKLWICQSQTNIRVAAVEEMASAQSIAVERVKQARLDRIATAHQGILAWCRSPVEYDNAWLQRTVHALPRLLVLDRITDSHNLGACLRSADAAGIDAVLLSKHASARITAGTAKAASGALFRLPVVRVPLVPSIKQLKTAGYTVVGLSEHAQTSIFALHVGDPVVLILGSEQTGISKSVTSLCDHLVAIPTRGNNASLNVSVATGIALFTLFNNRIL